MMNAVKAWTMDGVAGQNIACSRRGTPGAHAAPTLLLPFGTSGCAFVVAFSGFFRQGYYSHASLSYNSLYHQHYPHSFNFFMFFYSQTIPAATLRFMDRTVRRDAALRVLARLALPMHPPAA